MNSRQRRGVVLMVLSAVCALVALVGVLGVVRNVNSKVGDEKTAYRLKNDIAPYKSIDASQFEKVSVPKRWLPDTAVTELGALRGKIAVTTLHRGSLLQDDMIVNRPALRAGEQEIAIMIDAATGVAGKITPGSSVNIYATFKAQNEGQKDESRLIVERAQVLDVGKLTPFDQNNDDNRNRTTEAVPITFGLGTGDAQRVAYAESFATHVRLALVGAGEQPPAAAGPDRTYTLDKDK
ncbi:Flp pilus assembly protein CpaB [Streptomyces sp. SPB074]|uniref:Flp pilus assembly protein CpaB n=1 Tax=Streptomyces sp. (strain SPB074) TaxID=465543 RepID=UPI000560862B|nr:Flp pilus assembly protein CpaB [Streptomyces sp. SPB074]